MIIYSASRAKAEDTAREADQNIAFEPEPCGAIAHEPELATDEIPVMVAAGPQPRMFGDMNGADEPESAGEDLDVPAFMRRGGL